MIISCVCENELKGRFKLSKNSPGDAKNYDYYSKRKYLTTPNNLIESAIHMLMGGLGGGLVALHAAYMECGLFTAMAVNVLLSAIVGYCVCILVWSAQNLYRRLEIHELTYPDVMEAAVCLSPWPWFRSVARGLRYLVEVSLLCHLYGTCCVFIIMIARNLKELGTGDGAINDSGNPSLKVIILCLMVPCAVICMITDLKNFAPFALVCDLFGVALILMVLWYSLHDIKDSPMDRPPFKSVMGLVEFICICIFVLEPICYALPIESNMKQPKKFHYVVLAAMPIYTVAMLTVGFFGYWYYGEYAVAPITVHFPFSSFTVTLKVFLCLSLYVVYSLYFYLAFDLQWYYLRRNHASANHWFWERVYRTIHVVAITLIAYSVPNVTRMMGILGAISTIPAVLIYPPFIDLLVNWEHPGLGPYKWRLLKSMFIMSLGMVLVVAGSYYNIIGMKREISSNLMLKPHKTIEKSEIFWRRNMDFNSSVLKYNLTYDRRDINISEYKNKSVTYNPYNVTFKHISVITDNTLHNNTQHNNNNNNNASVLHRRPHHRLPSGEMVVKREPIINSEKKLNNKSIN